MMRSKLVLLLALLCLCTQTRSIQYQHDELLYSKQLWDEFKLPFPYAFFKEEDAIIARTKETVAGLFLEDSLSGPQENLQELIEQDLKRGKFQLSSFDITLIDENASLPGAASVAQCKTCLAFVTLVWHGVVDWTHRTLNPITADDILKYADDLCEFEIVNEILKQWVILGAKVHNAELDEYEQFYMLSYRHRQHAKVREMQVIRTGCRALLSEKHNEALERNKPVDTFNLKDVVPSELLVAMAAKQNEYLKMLQDKGATPSEDPIDGPGGTPAAAAKKLKKEDQKASAKKDDKSGDESKKEQEEEDDADSLDRPRPYRKCFNKHPQCEFWAERGECTNNPVYMIGTPKTGWCRPACYECVRPARPKPGSIAAEDIEELNEAAKAFLDQLYTSGCTKAEACRWAEGEDDRHTFASSANVDAAQNAAVLRATIIAGPIDEDSSDYHAAGDVDPQLMASSAISDTLPFHRAVVSKTSAEKKKIEDLQYPPGSASVAERILFSILGQKCVYVSTGWWSYEVCYMDSTTQYHMTDGDDGPDWVISLGKFDSADYKILNATSAVLFSEDALVPYVKHKLINGNDCEITGENGVSPFRPSGKESGNGDDEIDPESEEDYDFRLALFDFDDPDSVVIDNGDYYDGDEENDGDATPKSKHKRKIGDVVKRSTLLRFMCSPDSKMHVTVAEPGQCRYIVDVYVPELCDIPEMQPHYPEFDELVEQAKREEEQERKKREDKSGSGGRNKGWGRKKAQDDDDDPYLDPDEL